MPVFFATLILYLLTIFPSVAPYRDTGEMVSVAFTLGIAHPPGYPFYTLLSKIFLLILPWGNAGYRLNVLSALAGAGTAYLVYLILKKNIKNNVLATVISMLLATSYLQWYLSLVSEMYTINTLFAALVLLLIFKALDIEGQTRKIQFSMLILSAFVFGLGLGNRLDLIFLGPAALWIIFQYRKVITPKQMFHIALMFTAGFSVYLYLPIRSEQYPLLDWNHPATFQKLWGTLSRKTHGGTLDLISAGYAQGENFISSMKFYFSHLLSGFAFIGLPAGILGIVAMIKRDRQMAGATAIIWILAGPVFIFLANIPPNTHALAILEAHFLLPNAIFALWIGEGILYMFCGKRKFIYAGIILTCAMLCFNLAYHFSSLNKRSNFVSYDYSKNILRSLPSGSIAVIREDVQLFSLWNKQYVEKMRPDLSVVGQGLAGSSWYQKGFGSLHPEIKLGPLRSAVDWQRFMEQNQQHEIYFSGDANYISPDGWGESHSGLLTRITRGGDVESKAGLLEHIYPFRGDYSYNSYREFFTPDLIEEYSKAWMSLGQHYLKKKKYNLARRNFNSALSMTPDFPLAWNYIAFTHFDEGDYAEAKKAYIRAIEKYEKLIKLTEQYNSMPEVKAGVSREYSDVYISLGVCAERLTENLQSLEFYQKAVEIYPGQAKAYFNRAVIFWKADKWENVVQELEKALRINPDYSEAEYYLLRAKQKLNEKI